MSGFDLKKVRQIWDGLRIDYSGGCNEYRQDAICSDSGISTMEHILSHSQSLQRRLSGSHVSLLRTVARNGICTDDISGKPARYRSMSDGSNAETLSHGDFQTCQQINSGRCKRNTGLVNIRRTCAPINRASSEALCRRTISGRFGQYGLCDGFYNYRPVPVSISVGAFSHNQSRSQNAYSFGHKGCNPKLYPYFRRQVARRQRHGHADSGGRRFLHYGSGIHGFPTSVYTASSRQFFRNEGKGKSRFQAGLFCYGGSDNRGNVRSANSPEWPLQQTIISGTVAAHSVQSAGYRQNIGFFEQSQNAARLDHMRFIQKPMGDRTVFQVDQTEPSYQEFLRNIGECSQNANLDCGIGLCADSDYQKAPESGDAALHFSADFVGNSIRENALAASICRSGLQYE